MLCLCQTGIPRASFADKLEVIRDHFGPLGCNFQRAKRRIPPGAGHRLSPRQGPIQGPAGNPPLVNVHDSPSTPPKFWAWIRKP
eukprot:5837142-Pyramimonas_sp.AAC.1